MDKNKNIDVEVSNVKYVLGGIKEVIDEIIIETNSQNTPISINVLNEHHEKMRNMYLRVERKRKNDACKSSCKGVELQAHGCGAVLFFIYRQPVFIVKNARRSGTADPRRYTASSLFCFLLRERQYDIGDQCTI